MYDGFYSVKLLPLQDMSTLLWSFAELGHPADQFHAAAAAQFISSVESFTPAGLAAVSWSFAAVHESRQRHTQHGTSPELLQPPLPSAAPQQTTVEQRGQGRERHSSSETGNHRKVMPPRREGVPLGSVGAVMAGDGAVPSPALPPMPEPLPARSAHFRIDEVLDAASTAAFFGSDRFTPQAMSTLVAGYALARRYDASLFDAFGDVVAEHVHQLPLQVRQQYANVA